MYFDEFIVKPQKEKEREEKEKVMLLDIMQKEKEKPLTQQIIEYKSNQLEELRREVRAIADQTKTLQKKVQHSVVCKNPALIKKLAPTIYNALNTYFNDIFSLFIDDILEEEVKTLTFMSKYCCHTHTHLKSMIII